MRGVTAFLAALVLVGCGEIEDIYITEVEPEVKGSFQASLSPLPTRPTAGGRVDITQYTAYFVAEAILTGLKPDTTYAWKAYFGTCDAKLVPYGGSPTPSAFPVITTDATGAGTARATVSGRIRPDSTYNLRVYSTPAVSPVSKDTAWYACGNVQPK